MRHGGLILDVLLVEQLSGVIGPAWTLAVVKVVYAVVLHDIHAVSLVLVVQQIAFLYLAITVHVSIVVCLKGSLLASDCTDDRLSWHGIDRLLGRPHVEEDAVLVKLMVRVLVRSSP